MMNGDLTDSHAAESKQQRGIMYLDANDAIQAVMR